MATFDLCAVCCLPFRDELRWQVAFDTDMAELGRTRPLFNEAPVHEVCALYSAQVCPFVSSPHARLGDEYRKGQKRAKVLVLAGFDSTASVVGQSSEIQPDTAIIMFEMGTIRRTHSLASSADAVAAYAAAFDAEEDLQLDEHEQRLVRLLCEPTPEGGDAGPLMAGAAWIIGAAFCPEVRRVQGMSRLANSEGDFYFQTAAHGVFDPDNLSGLTEAKDESIAAAAGWFTTRLTLPQVLRNWRAAGAKRISRATSSGGAGSATVSGGTGQAAGRGALSSKSADRTRRKSAAASRKANRRKKR